mmetsp:Transcript_62529/g.122862  ORF Transcript_62529/g.122862 Transcript_62529/m.122862 type:complete len:372 (+) Transcript_62529:62-1177(+)
MAPSVTFSWQIGEPVAQEMTSTDDTNTQWIYNRVCIVSQPDNDDTEGSAKVPCFVDVSIASSEFGPIARVNRVGLVSNARHIELYSDEVKKKMEGGSLPPSFEYCETARGSKFGEDGDIQLQQCQAAVPETSYALPPSGHRVRIKLISLRPSKTQAHIMSVSITIGGVPKRDTIVDASGASGRAHGERIDDTPGASNGGDCGHRIDLGGMSGCQQQQQQQHQQAGATSLAPASAAAAAGMTKEELRSALAGAMFAVDARVGAACAKVETKLAHRLSKLETTVAGIAATVHTLKVQSAPPASKPPPALLFHSPSSNGASMVQTLASLESVAPISQTQEYAVVNGTYTAAKNPRKGSEGEGNQGPTGYSGEKE